MKDGKNGAGRGALPVITIAPWHSAVEAALVRHGSKPSSLIDILHDVQGELRHVPSGAVPVIANALNLSRAEVHGVVTFYHDFRDHTPGRHVLRICRAESCQAVGSDALVARAKAVLGVADHGTSADGGVTLEPVYCLGNCALSPAVTLDDQLYGRMTPDRLQSMLLSIEENAPEADR